MARVDKAVLAAGCLWGMPDLFRKRRGVVSTRVGYAGGDMARGLQGQRDAEAQVAAIKEVLEGAV